MKKFFVIITFILLPILIWSGFNEYKKRSAHKQYMTAVSLFAEKRDLDKALEIIDQVIDRNVFPKQKFNFYYKKAEIYHYLSKEDQAIACLDKVIEVEPHCIDAYNFKATILDNMGKREESIIIYDEAIKNNPSNQDILKYRDEFLERKKDLELD